MSSAPYGYSSAYNGGYPPGSDQDSRALNWKPYLGEPNGAFKRDAMDGYTRSLDTLEYAYRGQNRYIEAIVITLLSEQDQVPVRLLLPWTEWSDGLVITWDIWEFDDHLLSVIPETGVGRYISNRVSSNSAQLFRQGLGMQLGWDFYNTPRGKKEWKMQILQIVNATTVTMCLNVVLALMNPAYYNTKAEDRFAIKVNSREAASNFIFKRITDTFGLNKEVRFPARILSESQDFYHRLNHTSADTVYCASGQLRYWNALDGGTAQYVYDPNGTRLRLNVPGMKIIPGVEYPQGPNMPPVNPLVSIRYFSTFMTMSAQHVENSPNYTTEQRDIWAYSDRSDNWERIKVWDVARNAGVFINEMSTIAAAPDDLGGGGFKGSKVNSLSPEIGEEFYAGCASWGEYMKLHGVLDKWISFLKVHGIMDKLLEAVGGELGSKQVEKSMPDAASFATQIPEYNEIKRAGGSGSSGGFVPLPSQAQAAAVAPPLPSRPAPPLPSAPPLESKTMLSQAAQSLWDLMVPLCKDQPWGGGALLNAFYHLHQRKAAIALSADFFTAMIAHVSQGPTINGHKQMMDLLLDMDYYDYRNLEPIDIKKNPNATAVLKYNGTKFGWFGVTPSPGAIEYWLAQGVILHLSPDEKNKQWLKPQFRNVITDNDFIISVFSAPLGTAGFMLEPADNTAPAKRAVFNSTPFWIPQFSKQVHDKVQEGNDRNLAYVSLKVDMMNSTLVNESISNNNGNEHDWNAAYDSLKGQFPILLQQLSVIPAKKSAGSIFVGGSAYSRRLDDGVSYSSSSSSAGFEAIIRGLDMAEPALGYVNDIHAVYDSRVLEGKQRADGIYGDRTGWQLTDRQLRSILVGVNEGAAFLQASKCHRTIVNLSILFALATLENDQVIAGTYGNQLARLRLSDTILSILDKNKNTPNAFEASAGAIAAEMIQIYILIRQQRINSVKETTTASNLKWGNVSKYLGSVFDAVAAKHPEVTGPEDRAAGGAPRSEEKRIEAILNSLPIRGELFYWGMKHNAPSLMNYLLLRNPRYRATTAIVMKRNGFCGYTFHRKANVFLSINATQQIINVNMTIWAKSIVTNPKGVMHLRDIHADEYCGGNHITIMNALDDMAVEQYKQHDPEADIIVIPMHPDEDMTSQPYFDLTGRMHPLLSPSIFARDTPKMYSTADIMVKRYGFAHDRDRHPLDQDPFQTGAAPNQHTLCFRDQYKVHGGTRTGIGNNTSGDRVINGQHMWGKYVWPGCKQLRLAGDPTTLNNVLNAKEAAGWIL